MSEKIVDLLNYRRQLWWCN